MIQEKSSESQLTIISALQRILRLNKTMLQHIGAMCRLNVIVNSSKN